MTEKMGSVAVEMEVVETAEAKTAVAVRVEEGGGEGGGGDGGGDGGGGEGGGDGEVPGTETTAVYTTTQPNARKAWTRMAGTPFWPHSRVRARASVRVRVRVSGS